MLLYSLAYILESYRNRNMIKDNIYDGVRF